MPNTVLLDSGPLGILTAPPGRADTRGCARWLSRLISSQVRIIVPEITDYELRRELLRSKKTGSVQRLDDLNRAIEYLPLTTGAMHRAATLWAEARQRGQPTAHDDTIDVDMILAAQALTLGLPDIDIVVATTNVGHLSRFVPADLWQNITP